MLAVSLSGWYIGFTLGGVTITVVVILVGTILGEARIIAGQALAITESLDDGRLNTMALWDVDLINRSVIGINRNAAKARAALESQG